jgi:DNA-binding SARP family transcriptional activator
MDFRLLGPLEVVHEGTPLPLGPRRQQALLARLVLDAGRTIAVERLVDDLWGEDVPDSAVKMVQIYVSHLRKVLPDGVLVTRPPGYGLDVDPESVDAVRFARLRDRGRAELARGDAAAGAATLRAALDLWRGPALAEFGEPFAVLERAHADELRAACLEDRIDADLALGRHADLVAELERLVAGEPLRERLREQLMLALFRCGRHADALEAFRAYRTMLDEELGLEPSQRLRDLEQAVLEQDAGLAVATPADPVAAAPSRPVPPGRDAELAQLERALAATVAGARRAVLLTGEPGIGKTTLVEALLARLPAGTLVAQGQCVETGGASEPYHPVLDALARAGAGPDGAAITAVLDERAPTWLAELPWLVPEERRGELAERAISRTRDRMLREAVEALEALATQRPVVLVLEHLQWADPSSIALLDALLRRPHPARILVLAVAREAPPGSQLAGLLRDLAVRGTIERLPLGPLPPQVVAGLVADRLDGTDPELTALIVRRSGGNPLFAAALLDELASSGPEGLTATPDSDLRAVVEQWLAGVEGDDAAVLRAASIAGAEPEVAGIAAALGAELADVERAVTGLAERGLLRRVDGHVVFAHELVREAAAADVPPATAAQLHGRIAAWLEAQAGAEGTAPGPDLAWHLVRSEQHERAVRVLRAAAERAIERAAPEEAVSHLAAALDAAGRLPATPARTRLEVELLSLTGQARVAIGGWSDPEAEHALRRACELAEGLGDNEPLIAVLLTLSTLYEVRGDIGRARETADACLRISPDGPPSDALPAQELFACNLFHLGLFGPALEQADIGAAMAEEGEAGHYTTFPGALGDHSVVSCHDWAGLALWFLGRPDEALRRAEHARAIAEQPARAYSEATAAAQLAVLHQCRGEPHATREWAEATLTAARARGYAYRAATGRILHGWAIAALGNPRDGVAEIELGIEAARATGAHMDEPYALGLLADAHLRAGHLDAARSAVEQALSRARREPSCFFTAELLRLRGEVHVARGAPEEARRSFEAALAVAREQRSPSLELRAAISLARLAGSGPAEASARAALERAYERFDEGFETPDLREAAALLGRRSTGAAGEQLERRPVSVLAWEVADLAGHLEELGPAELARALSARMVAATALVEEAGGEPDHTWDTGGVAWFSDPAGAEEAAARAVRAGLRIVEAQSLFRAAVHSGELTGAGPPSVVEASRLVPAARAGELVVGDVTGRLLSAGYELAPAGLSVQRVVGVRSAA